MNVKELQAEAARLGIKGRSKMNKDELVGAVLHHPDSRVTTNRSGELTLKEDLQPESVTDGIVDKDDLVPLESLDPPEATANLGLAEKVRTETDRLLTLARTGNGAPMPLHWRGRAQGAKHHKTPNQKRAEVKEALRKLEALNRVGVTHKPNSERVQAYARQNVAEPFQSHLAPQPMLTHRQMRRVKKNTRKHAEGFVYSWPTRKARTEFYPREGYSLLARTPSGEGIFYGFLK